MFNDFEGFKRIKNTSNLTIEGIYEILEPYQKEMGEMSYISNLGVRKILVKLDGKYDAEILRVPDYEKLDNPYLYGMPILFPVNRISDGEFVFEGRRYTFPINEPETNCHLHGFLHTAEFKIEEQREDYIKCVYESDELYSFLPHKFKVEIVYSLSENGLLQETCVHNLSGKNMPVFLGFHTTFNVPFIKNSKAENIRVFAEVGDVIERNMSTYLPTGRIIASVPISLFISDPKLSRKKLKYLKKPRITSGTTTPTAKASFLCANSAVM